MTSELMSSASNLDILIVDDHSLIAETVASSLAHSDSFHVDFVSNVAAAIDKISARGPYRVVLLDYFLPGTDGLSALQEILAANQGHVAIFSGVAGWTVAERAIEQGACGFLPKSIALKTLANALRFMADGEVYLSADYIRHVSQASDYGHGLKPREMRVLSFLSEGKPNKEIGRELGIEETIVKMDVKSICRKLKVSNRTQAVIEAQKLGLF